MKRFFKFLFPVVFLAVGFAGFQYITANREDAPSLARKTPEPFVFVQQVSIRDEVPSVRLFGTVETPDFGSLTAAVEADVEKVSVLEGDSVKKGDLLISLNSRDIELEIQQRQAELQEIEASINSDRVRHDADKQALETEKRLLELIRKSVERAERLVETSAGSHATLDNALQNEARQQLAIIQREQSINDFPARQKQLKARLNKARAGLRKAERGLDRTRIVAPFDGRIAEVMVTMGDRVARGGKLLNLYNESGLEVRAQVPSSFVSALQGAINESRPVVAQAVHENHRIELALHRLSALIEQGQGGVDAFFRSTAGQLPALGSTLAILVYMPVLKDVVPVPPDALYGGKRVYLVSDGILEPREVRQAGVRIEGNGNQTILLDGSRFSPGEYILTSRLPQAVGGLKVRIVERDGNGS
ncbi:MAG: biotin/lipoyl-binding protein [Gammaproteobacteria bacterium]|nr:biotin/lipoyl-binding protein [Gammaproteobacteria bacterium]